MKYIPGNIFINITVQCISGIAAYITSGFLLKLLGIKMTFLCAFGIATLGGTLMICFFSIDSAMAVFVLLSSFGTAFAFNTCYLATPMVFPVAITSTAFGVCNLIARGSTIFSPIVAELAFPVPMVAFTLFSALAGLCSLCA